MSVRTSPGKNYIPPTREEMREDANKFGIKTFSPSLVEDICNLISGGRFNSPSEMKDAIASSLSADEFTVDEDGDYRYDGRLLRVNTEEYAKTLKTLSEAKDVIASEKSKYHQKVQKFLQQLDIQGIPGNSPLERAMGLLSLLSKKKGGSPSKDGDILPIFSNDKASPETIASEINEAIDTAESLNDEEKSLINQDGKSTLQIAQDILSGSGKREILSISRQLDKFVDFNVARINKLTPNPNGSEVKYRGIGDLSEIDRLHPSEWVYPKTYRNYRLVTGQSQVRERCDRIEKKQLLYLLIDCSGSMQSDDRFYKAGGVLMNRLKAVLKGDAEVFFAFFDNTLKAEQSARNAEEAKKAMELIQESNFNGGGTKISVCTKQAIARIAAKLTENPSLTRPELVVVTDGEDDVSDLNLEGLQGVRLHAFLVGGDNRHLVDLARRNGGVGISDL